MTERKPTIAGLQAEINELQQGLAESRQMTTQALRRVEELQKQLIGAGQENDQLRDRLHEMTVQIARLEGYRDRVLEFDPVTERQAYLDEGGELAFDEHRGAPPSFVTRRRQQRHGLAEGGGMNAASHAPHWYRRRG